MVTINVKWIDVEDELPDKEEYYWVTILNEEDGSFAVNVDLYLGGYWEGYSNDEEWSVIAWAKIDFPEPYQNRKLRAKWLKKREKYINKIIEESYV